MQSRTFPVLDTLIRFFETRLQQQRQALVSDLATAARLQKAKSSVECLRALVQSCATCAPDEVDAWLHTLDEAFLELRNNLARIHASTRKESQRTPK